MKELASSHPQDIAAPSAGDFRSPLYDYASSARASAAASSALRLVEKGYRVLLLEKGSSFDGRRLPEDQLGRAPLAVDARSSASAGSSRCGSSGTSRCCTASASGGGSLATRTRCPIPKRGFFASPSWAHLADWEGELAPHYATARRMLGAAPNPNFIRRPTYPAQVARDDRAARGRSSNRRRGLLRQARQSACPTRTSTARAPSAPAASAAAPA